MECVEGVGARRNGLSVRKITGECVAWQVVAATAGVAEMAKPQRAVAEALHRKRLGLESSVLRRWESAAQQELAIARETAAFVAALQGCKQDTACKASSNALSNVRNTTEEAQVNL